jgi:hypothetical protein
MAESIYEFVMSELARNHGHLPRVERETGIPIATLRRIKSKETLDPSIHTIEKLAAYFREDLQKRLNGANGGSGLG